MSEANEANRTSYERIAGVYAGEAPTEEDPVMRSACRDVFRERLKGRRILEVGCGPGNDSRAFHELGLQVTATDFCDEFVALVKQRFPFLRVEKMDMTRPSLPPGSFDGIYGFSSFLHLPRAVAAATLRGLRDLLTPGGVLFLAMIGSTRLREYVIPDWGGTADNPMLFTCYEEAEFGELLEHAGFQEIEFFHITSPVYENMSRLVERGVTGWQVTARRA